MKHHLVKRLFGRYLRKRLVLWIIAFTFLYLLLYPRLQWSDILRNIIFPNKDRTIQNAPIFSVKDQLHVEWNNYMKSVEDFQQRFSEVDKKYLKTRKQKTNYTYFSYEHLVLFQEYSKDNKIPEHNRFSENDPNTLTEFTLQEDKTTYFLKHKNLDCFMEGTNWNQMHQVSPHCECNNGWYGKWCSFPEELQASKLKDHQIKTISLRKKPRRLINCFPINIELEMLEIKFAELYSITDLFIILESNYTGYGDPKPLYLLSALKKGFLQKYHDKILYYFSGYFPDEAYLDGWISDNIRHEDLGKALKSQVHGLREDDLILLTDADEVPTKNSLLFLKNHDGYDEPIGFKMIKNTYGFFWKDTTPWNVMSVVSYGMVTQVYSHVLRYLRNPSAGFKDNRKALDAYKAKGHHVKPWFLGNDTYYAGWHCTYCFPIKALRIKLQSVINEDYPRHGDNDINMQLSRLKHLVGDGYWFTDEKILVPTNISHSFYAPKYALANFHRFQHILVNKFK